MKKFAKFTLLCLIPIVTGVVCFIVGNTVGDSTVSYVGILALAAGLPAMMVVFLIVWLILMSTGKLGDGGKAKSDTADATSSTSAADEDDGSRRRQESEYVQCDSSATSNEESAADDKTTAEGEARDGAAEEEVLSQREREQKEIDAVNGSSYFESRVNMAKYEARHVKEGMKTAPKWGVAVGITLFFLLVADVIVATVLLINRYFVGAIVCASIFGVVVISALLYMTISRAIATNGDIRKAKKITEGTVKSCLMSGTTTTKTGGMRNKTARVNSVKYRVSVSADGEEYAAFSNRFYETDEKVTVAVMGKKRAKIVDEAALEEPNKSTEEK